MSSQPRHSPAVIRARTDVVTENMDGEIIAWDPVANRIHRLDRLSSLLWPFFDGTVTTADLASEVAESFGVPADEAHRYIAQIGEQLESAGLLR